MRARTDTQRTLSGANVCLGPDAALLGALSARSLCDPLPWIREGSHAELPESRTFVLVFLALKKGCFKQALPLLPVGICLYPCPDPMLPPEYDLLLGGILGSSVSLCVSKT